MSLNASIIAIIKRPPLIVANTSGMGTGSSSDPVIELKNAALEVSQSYVHNLLDVVESSPVDGDTLIYDSTLHKYVVKPLEIAGASLDGGGF